MPCARRHQGGCVFRGSEPTVEDVRRAAAAAGCDAVMAMGGGSALDAGKAIAALMANGGDPLDYLEVVGAGCRCASLPCRLWLCRPRRGTGSEVTRTQCWGCRKLE
jgi:alcohol dehydrogenase class IV